MAKRDIVCPLCGGRKLAKSKHCWRCCDCGARKTAGHRYCRACAHKLRGQRQLASADQRFIDELEIDGPLQTRELARRLGYSLRSVLRIAARLLAKERVNRRVNEADYYSRVEWSCR